MVVWALLDIKWRVLASPKGYLEDESQKWSGGICEYVHA
jgi:hypothetical protein